MVESPFHSTTICAVEKTENLPPAGDGQVTMGESVVMKGTAKKSTTYLQWRGCCRFRRKCRRCVYF